MHKKEDSARLMAGAALAGTPSDRPRYGNRARSAKDSKVGTFLLPFVTGDGVTERRQAMERSTEKLARITRSYSSQVATVSHKKLKIANGE